MLELVGFFFLVVPALALRAQQRDVNKVSYVVALIGGFASFSFLGLLGLGLAAVVLRWIWIGGVFLVVEFLTNRGRKAAGTWQCSNCRMFNDLRTLKCGCGTRYEPPPDLPIDAQLTAAPGLRVSACFVFP